MQLNTTTDIYIKIDHMKCLEHSDLNKLQQVIRKKIDNIVNDNKVDKHSYLIDTVTYGEYEIKFEAELLDTAYQDENITLLSYHTIVTYIND